MDNMLLFVPCSLFSVSKLTDPVFSTNSEWGSSQVIMLKMKATVQF